MNNDEQGEIKHNHISDKILLKKILRQMKEPHLQQKSRDPGLSVHDISASNCEGSGRGNDRKQEQTSV